MQYFREVNRGGDYSGYMYYLQQAAYWHQMAANNPGLQPTLTPLEYANLVLQYSYIQRQLQNQATNIYPLVHSQNQAGIHHLLHQPKTENHLTEETRTSASPKPSRFDFSRLAESATSDLTPNVEDRHRHIDRKEQEASGGDRKEQEASTEACAVLRNNSATNNGDRSRLTRDLESDDTDRDVDVSSQLQQKRHALLDLGSPCSLYPKGPQLLTENNIEP